VLHVISGHSTIAVGDFSFRRRYISIYWQALLLQIHVALGSSVRTTELARLLLHGTSALYYFVVLASGTSYCRNDPWHKCRCMAHLYIIRCKSTYPGATTINGGTLALSGSGSIANSPTITVGSGATFNVTALTTALSFRCRSKIKRFGNRQYYHRYHYCCKRLEVLPYLPAGLAFTAYGGGSTAPLTVTGASAGALALNSAPVTVTTTTALAAGTYTLIAKGGSATGVSGTPGTLTM
jgi:hypothetical protein